MTSTGDAIASGGANVRYVLAIEAYGNLLTDAEDPAKAVTAWAATSWGAALPGLKFGGAIEQKIDPFSENIDVSVLTFEITPDETDAFGRAVWRSKPSFETRLNAPFQATLGATNIQGKSFAVLPSSGTVYLGRLAISYASKTGSQQLNVNAGNVGVFAPFTADGATNFPWHFPTSPGEDGDVAANPKITDVPRATSWRGRWVGLYMHKANGPAWAVKTQAECIWAGKIAELMQGPKGRTFLQCEEVRSAIRDCVLLKRQFRGRVKEGIYLASGQRFRFREPDKDSNWFTIGTDYPAGYTSLERLFGALNEFAAAEKTATRLDSSWNISVVAAAEGYRVRIARVESGGPRARGNPYSLECSHGQHLDFMGFETREKTKTGYEVTLNDEVYSDEPPLRVLAIQRNTAGNPALDIENARGVWVTHSTRLPQPVRGWTKPGEDRSYIMIGDDVLAFAKKTGALSFTEIRRDDPLSATLRRETKARLRQGKTYDESGDLEVRQVVAIGGKVSFVLTALLASMEGNGVNHADYDVFPFGAGIPWGLLGDNWINSLKSLEQTAPSDGMMVVLDKPRPLSKILMPQLLLRFGFLVYRNGGLQVTSPPVPNPAYADHELDETNMAAEPGEEDAVAVRESRDWMVNVLKVEYDRIVATDEYRDSWTMEDSVSVAQYGERVLTIRMPDTYAGASDCGVDLKSLVGALAARVFPVFGHPLLVLRRSLSLDKWLLATPGQTATLTAREARNPTDGSLGDQHGEGGMQERGVTIMSQWHDWGHEGGKLASEVTLMYSEEDRTFPYAPAADVDAAASTNTVLKLQQHGFSQAADPKDVTHWQVGDAVRVLRRDPVDPANPDTFTTLLIDVDEANDEVELDDGFGSGGRPALDPAGRYVLIPDDYVASDDDQLLTSYQADDADALIQDVIEPNLYADDQLTVYDEVDGTELYERHSDVESGDGKPFTSWMVHKLCVAHNNLLNYKTAINNPMHLQQALNDASQALRAVRAVPIGVGVWPVGYRRVFTIRMRAAIDDAGETLTVRVTTSRSRPTGGTSIVTFHEPFRQITFTLTGTTAITLSAAQELEPILARPGITFISVEAWVSGGAEAVLYGFPQFELGPLETV